MVSKEEGSKKAAGGLLAASNGGEDRNQAAKGREVALDFLGNLRDGSVERVDLLKVESEQKAVMARLHDRARR